MHRVQTASIAPCACSSSTRIFRASFAIWRLRWCSRAIRSPPWPGAKGSLSSGRASAATATAPPGDPPRPSIPGWLISKLRRSAAKPACMLPAYSSRRATAPMRSLCTLAGAKASSMLMFGPACRLACSANSLIKKPALMRALIPTLPLQTPFSMPAASSSTTSTTCCSSCLPQPASVPPTCRPPVA